MAFTDDDLKRLKEIAEFSSDLHFKHTIPALLARLEAADKVCMETDNWDSEAHIAWRKSAGK